ncbi:MAG: hypothetical protein ABSE95_19210 [Thermodesulfobacteriota bacterium]|jgi:hypothetical protein
MNTFTKKILLLLFSLIILSLTLPRLILNYGFERDTVRGVLAADHFVKTGIYIPSRLPGNPLFEYVLAAIAPWGKHVATNTFVLLTYCLALWAFSCLAKKYNHALLLILLFAATPLILLYAVTTKDYISGLALILCAYIAVQKDYVALSFILTGLAAGMRLSNFLFLVPLALFLLMNRQKLLKIIALTMLGLCVGLVLYLPVLSRYGLQMFIIPPSHLNPKDYLFKTAYNLIMLFGPITSLGIAGMFLLNIKNIRQSVVQNMPSFILEASTVILFIVLFLRHSDQTAYLIPVIPFAYLIFAQIFSHKQLMLVVVLVISFAFFTVELKGGDSGHRKITPYLSWGILVKDYQNRKSLNDLRRAMTHYAWPDKTFILTGAGPIVTYNNPGLEPSSLKTIIPGSPLGHVWESVNVQKIKDKDVYFVYALSEDLAKALQKKGYTLYIFSEGAPGIVMNVYKYDPYRIGIQKLDVFCDKPFYRQR